MGFAHQLHLKGQPLVVAIFMEKYPLLPIHILRYGSKSTKSQAGIGNASRSFITARAAVLTTAPDFKKARPGIDIQSNAFWSKDRINSSKVCSASPINIKSAPSLRYFS